MLTLDADGARLRPAAARGVALGPMPSSPIHLDAAESLVAEAARSRALAAGPGDGRSDALSRHLRPTVVVAAPLVAMGELHRVLVLARLQPTAGVWAGRRHPGRGVLPTSPPAPPRTRCCSSASSRCSAQAQHPRVGARRAVPPARLAEQDERRKLSLHLHDGPLQTLSGVA